MKLPILLALFLVGCGPLGGLGLDDPSRMAYQPPVARVGADQPTSLAAVKGYVSSLGWSLDEVDEVHGHVVAHVDTKDGYTLQRDTWTFYATPGFLSVRRRMALGDTNGTSFVTSADEVCAAYTYASEETHLTRIAGLIASAERAKQPTRSAGTTDATLIQANNP
jgi:hypothetical protein